ncbi:MAG: thiol-activated cytolysin family protein [Spirochaetales bacterium]|nr:thiol-activated cytolysin family protein [Spirochaetales bacterium]
MKSFTNTKICLLLLHCFFFIIVSCNDVAHDIAFPEQEIINSNIRNLSIIDQPEETGIIRIGLSENQNELPQVPNHDHTCIIYKYKAQIGFYDNVCLRLHSPVIWPGALIAGHTITTGEYIPISAKRKTISFDIFSADGSTHKTIANPTYSKVTSAITNNYISTKNSTPASQVKHRMETIHSADQLKIVLAAHLPVSEDPEISFLNDLFDFESTTIITRKMIEFTYIYYTVDINRPSDPGKLFDPSVSWEELESQISGDISPVYVSSVQYGRTALFFIESPYDDKELTAALNYAIDNVTTEELTDIEKYKLILDNTKITTYITDNNATPTIQTFSGFENFRTKTTQAKNTDYGAFCNPIAYRLQYLKNNEDVRIVLSAEYFKRECEELPFYLTIISRLEGGEPLIREREVQSSSVVNLFSTESYSRSSAEYRFSRWNHLQGNSLIVNSNMNDTFTTRFINDCTIVANYTMQLTPTPTPPPDETPAPTPPPTVPPTSPPTVPPATAPPSTEPPPEDTQTPTSSPTPSPEPTYSCVVTYLNSSNESVQETFNDLTYSSSIYISCPCTIIIGTGSPPGGTTLHFSKWNSNGNATVSSPNSCSSNVTHFTGNTTIGAGY